MFTRLGLQLYTVRDLFKGDDFVDLTFKKLHEMGIKELHTAGMPFSYELLGKLCKKYDMKVIGSHYDYNAILNNPEETKKIHDFWGTKNIGIGAMPGSARENKDKLLDFIKEFNAAAKEYAKDGYKLTYHNHNFEFARVDGTRTIMDYLYEGLDPDTTSFVLDTCWVAAGGGDVRHWMEKLAGRIDILHLKDMMLKNEGGKFLATMTEVGNGTLYWEGIIKTAEEIGVSHYIIEQDTNFAGGNPLISLEQSVNFLKAYMK